MTSLPERLDNVRKQLDGCASGIRDLEDLVLDLIGRADAYGDAAVVERAQAVDALAQQLVRLSGIVAELAAANSREPAS